MNKKRLQAFLDADLASIAPISYRAKVVSNVFGLVSRSPRTFTMQYIDPENGVRGKPRIHKRELFALKRGQNLYEAVGSAFSSVHSQDTYMSQSQVLVDAVAQDISRVVQIQSDVDARRELARFNKAKKGPLRRGAENTQWVPSFLTIEEIYALYAHIEDEFKEQMRRRLWSSPKTIYDSFLPEYQALRWQKYDFPDKIRRVKEGMYQIFPPVES